MLTPIVSARTRTSPAAGRGVGSSTYSRTDGSPVRVIRMAFIGDSLNCAGIIAARLRRFARNGNAAWGTVPDNSGEEDCSHAKVSPHVNLHDIRRRVVRDRRVR